MSRGWVIVIALAAIFAVFYFWGVPLLKEKFLGQSLQTRYKILNAVDERNVPFNKNGETVPRTIVDIELIFPMGRAPDNIRDLQVAGDDGKLIEVNWPTAPEPESGDLPDQGITKWILKDVYFPYGFREGRLRNKYGDLCTIQLGYVAPSASQ